MIETQLGADQLSVTRVGLDLNRPPAGGSAINPGDEPVEDRDAPVVPWKGAGALRAL